MPFIVYVKNSSGEIKKAWSLPQNKPHLDKIDSLYASKDELTHIDFLFKNIPIVKAESCTWTGEMAQFIFDNL